MSLIRFGVIGSGMIAAVVAKAIQQSANASLVAVASRRREKAQEFAAEHSVPMVFDDWRQLIQEDSVDAVYIATPTAGREEICLAALEAGKHLISEKPFISSDSVKRIAALASAKGLAFMDATHFTHHPRTQTVVEHQQAELGNVSRIRTSFFFPFMDRSNIRFDPAKEPTGAVGDMAWYSMRAIVEYMRPESPVKAMYGALRRDAQSGAVVGGAGLVEFSSGQTSSFDFGYDAGVCLMDLDIIGETGMIQLDDFVLDWKDGFAFSNPKHVTGFNLRQEMATPTEYRRVPTETAQPQVVHMVENFAAQVRQNDRERNQAVAHRAIETQELLDQFCVATGLQDN
ncbi:Gfo/Idh/MocA family oxidoreductase [Microbulbifer salipaludis]|uniref:Gfo/Idh/MocA family oxidoreductase n=1 Tax=Microbulbifer salipaludis TaxID=187980 RepID=A0ABS3E4C4_9GAMM|nr:Gfo/Idh/MocA family oxidoreductase [Microbulbifer salipaludis]MBN8430063.1 Gfo/Idh/MocA family oxidoreductase [Microbulbifer salipaludis]